MPSSSSSEEDLSKFKEAADRTLYNDSLFKNSQAKEEEKAVLVKPPSLRYMEEEDERLHNELRVTPEFQMHVAKHLSKLLDRQLELKDKPIGNVNPPNRTRRVIKARRGKSLSDTSNQSSSGGVRLLGASAVFLSNLNIVPVARKKKRGRKLACFSSGSESSSEESDSDGMDNLSASNKILGGDNAKCWDSKESKVERCVVNKSGILIPVRDDLSRGYESLTEISSSSNHNSKEVLNFGAKDDMAFLKINKKKKGSHLESELAASFSSVVSMGSDSQGDVPSINKKKKIKKKKKHRKEQHSEDATTETTEVEDVVEERRKKVKKGRKKTKRQRIDDRKTEEMAIIKECVPGLLEEDGDANKWKRKEKKKSKRSEKAKREESYLKNKSHYKLSKVSKVVSKKKMSKKVSRLSEDLAKLMMTSTEASCCKVDKL